MLDFLVSWAEQLIITLVIIVVIEMILPSESSYKKYIKVILGVFLIYTIISPIVSDKLNKLEFKHILKTENTAVVNTNNINYDDQVEETYKIKLKENINDYLKEKGYEIVKMNTDLSYKNGEIDIKSVNLVIKSFNNDKSIVVGKIKIEQDEKIGDEELEKIKVEISNYYDIDESKISVSESEK